MKKQSSIEWFQEQIIKIVNGTCELSEIQIFEQAKQMHKEEIIESYYMGDRYSCCGCYDSSTEEEAEDYYNEIFKEDAREQK